MFVTQQLLGQLRTMDQLADADAVADEMTTILRLVESSQKFQTLFNQELMGMEVDASKRPRDVDTPPGKKETEATRNPMPVLCLDQGQGPLQRSDVQRAETERNPPAQVRPHRPRSS